MNKNYQLGIQYELGIDHHPKDYRKAYKHYSLALQENVYEARKKVKYSRFSIHQLILIIMSLIIGILIDVFSVYPWVGMFVISITNIGISLFFKNKYWIKTGYANISNNIVFYSMAVILLPISTIFPYLRGVTWIPVVALFTISFFVAFSTLVIILTDRKHDVRQYFAIGLYLFILTIISFGIDTDDKRFIFYKVDNGVVISGYRSDELTLSIPNQISGYNVVGIDSNAFRNLQFETITFGDNLEFIGNNAFSGNRVVKEIVIPNGVILGNSVFADNYSLETVVLPNDLENLNNRMFYNNFQLKEISIPNSVTYIGSEVFKNSGLLSIEIPNNLEILGNDTFSNTKISELVFPDSLTFLGSISNMRDLTSFNIPNSITRLPANFISYNNLIEDFTIPSQVTEIGSYAFANTKLSNVTFHEGVTAIGEGLFYRAEGISEISLPSTITSIPRMMFAYSTIKEFHISSNITEIGNGAFLNTSKLERLTFDEGVRIIGPEAFSHNTLLEELILPNSIISIGNSSFSGMTNLKTVVLPANLQQISDGLFNGARSLQTINLPNSITRIGANAFRNNDLLSLTLPASLIEIGDSAFYGNTNLEVINFNEQLEKIGVYSFGSNNSLVTIELPDSVISIGDFAFNGSTNLQTAIIGSNTSHVGFWAFRSNPNLTIFINQSEIPSTWHTNWNPFDSEVIFLN